MVIPYFVYPIISFCLAQGTKILIKALNKKKLVWRDLVAYSDMPSGHTATVVSLSTIMFLSQGLRSPEFALAFVFMMIVITDAIGLRNYLGQHGKTLNVLVKDLKEDDYLDNSYPKQLERIGHTPMQVLIGAVLGFLVSFIGFFLF
jgi:acid phosphatase family membrane protein YuiD